MSLEDIDYTEFKEDVFVFSTLWKTKSNGAVKIEDMDLLHAENLYFWLLDRGYQLPLVLVDKLVRNRFKLEKIKVTYGTPGLNITPYYNTFNKNISAWITKNKELIPIQYATPACIAAILRWCIDNRQDPPTAILLNLYEKLY